jgi:hypothetical protein
LSFYNGAVLSWNFVQSSSDQFGSVSTTQTLPYNTNVTVGDLLIVDIGFTSGISFGPPSVADSQGNVYVRTGFEHDIGNTIGIAQYVAIAKATGANTVSVTPTTTTLLTFAIHEYSGNATSGVIDMPETNTGTAATTLTTGSIPVNNPGEMIHAAFAQITSSQTPTQGAGFTIREDQTGTLSQIALFTEDDFPVSTATAATATVSLGVTYVAIGTSFLPTGLTPPPDLSVTQAQVRTVPNKIYVNVPPSANDVSIPPPPPQPETNVNFVARGYKPTVITNETRPIYSFIPQDISTIPETNVNFVARGYKQTNLLPSQSFAPHDQTIIPNEADTSLTIIGYHPTSLTRPVPSFAPEDQTTVQETNVNLVVRGYHPTSIWSVPPFAPHDQSNEAGPNFVARGYHSAPILFAPPFAPHDQLPEENPHLTVRGYKPTSLTRPVPSFAYEDIPFYPEIDFVARGYRQTTIWSVLPTAPHNQSNEAATSETVRGYQATNLTRPVPSFTSEDQTTAQETNIDFVARGYHSITIQSVLSSAHEDHSNEENPHLVVRGYKPTTITRPVPSFSYTDIPFYPEIDFVARGYQPPRINMPTVFENQTVVPTEANTSEIVRGYQSTNLNRPFASKDVTAYPETIVNFTAKGYQPTSLNKPVPSFAPHDQSATPSEANTSQVVLGYQPTSFNMPVSPFAPQDLSFVPTIGAYVLPIFVSLVGLRSYLSKDS